MTIDLILSDCVKALSEGPAGCVDCIVTSPPYNIGIDYGTYRDDIPRKDYLNWTDSYARAFKHTLSEKGSVFLNVDGKPSDPWIGYEVANIFARYFVLQNRIVWVKSIAINGETKGHFKPIPGERFLNGCFETIYHFTHKGKVKLDRLALGVPYEDKTNTTRWKHGSDLRCRGNVWFLPYETIQSRKEQRPHPATFPVGLAENCYRLHGRIEMACDPFMGIGSAGVAAVKVGVSFTGYEIDPVYFEQAKKRIDRARGIA